MYIQTGQVFKWRQRKRKGNIVSILNRYLVMMPLVLISTAGIALAEPTGGVITGGSGTITQAESATNINQASPRLDINWRTFSTEVHESVNFTQPTADALAINRVIGGVPSELRGALNANGRVVILNDSGITFFGTSQVNVGALLATTAMNLSTDGDRLSFSGAGYGEVLNQGTIRVSDGGFAVLAAPYVSNTGFIQAKLGTIQLASANDFTVDFRGDGLIGFTVSKSTLDGIVEAGKPLGVDNTGTLLAGSGTIGISAAAASSIVQSVVNLDGVVDASSFGAGTNGGTVLVTSVGDINIDGVVHADGGVSGNGGTVTTWADATNIFGPGAVITARGGAVSGNGGFVELSGHDVRVRGTVNASAPNGEAGTFLIDPFNLIIADGAGSDSTATVFEQNIEATSVAGTNVDLVADHDITMNDLTTDGVLKGESGSISMTVTDGGTIWFENLNNKITTTTGSIFMSALDGVETPGSIKIGSLETTGNFADITARAGSGGITTANLTTGGLGLGVANPGVISLTTNNGGNITANNISIIAEGYSNANASLDINAEGSISVGSVLVKADASSEGSAHARAGADMKAGGDITVTGGIEVAANALGYYGDTTEADAHANLTAGNNIILNNGITVQASADNVNGSDATANAALSVTAGHDLNITGDILVKADATVGSYGYYNTAYANANATLTAGHDVTIDGNVDVEAKAVNNGTEAYEANADATLNITAGNSEAEIGNLKINGNITVVADATNYGTDTASANANAYLWAPVDINIIGDVTVRAKAVHNGSDDDASPNAYLNLDAGNDLTVTGNILVESTATRNNGRGGDDASADGSMDLYAGHDMNIKGDVKLIVNALVNQGSDANADANLEAYAGNDLKITGDILVRSDATMGPGGTDSADAHANAYISAGHNVTLLTDPITVAANAVSYSSDARANASLIIEAGTYCGYDGECTPSGDLYITGDVLALATATVTNPSSSDGYYYTHSSEYASVSLRAPDSITNLYGTAPPTAYAPNPNDPAHALAQSNAAGYFSDSFGSYSDGAEGYAELNIEAAFVTIEPKPVVSAPQPVEDNEHEVVSALETKEIRLIEPLGPGKDPLSFDADGLASWATGAGVTAPSEGSTLTPDIEEAIAKGVDPTTVLPAPAAGGGMGLSSGADAYSVGGPDFCDQVVSGYCLPQEGKKKIE